MNYVPFPHMTDKWNRRYLRYQNAENRRISLALAICDMVGIGWPVKGQLLRRFRRLDRLVKAYRRELFPAHVAWSLPLGGIDG